jgi:hypothetical protein
LAAKPMHEDVRIKYELFSHELHDALFNASLS